MSSYNVVASMSDSTVVAEYTPEKSKSSAYQSEADLEKEFIRLLQEQSYEYLTIHEEKDLIANLRKQLSKLNNYEFSDSEWDSFFDDVISNPNKGILDKTTMIQQDNVQVLHCDDGLSKNITLIDKKNIHNNSLQVINQYKNEEGNYKNRYDVTVLVNGFPLVHIELKRRGVPIREAFNEIRRYQRDSFWSGCGLYEYIQIFVISNGTNTKYYSNTTRESHVKELDKSEKTKKTSNSFEFTSCWADSTNRIIPDLVDFTKTFFSKHTILNILTKYCVLDTNGTLLVMRPYQIVATERIVNKIQIASNYKKYGTVEGGGFIWHTTGSGKTLTSFKTAQLATGLDEIDKVLFVVDRKDLDYQTMKEFDRFEKGAANGNRSTAILEKQLSDPNCKIIITTIQKLDGFIKKNKSHDIYNSHIVIIFDECQRSQFGSMHVAITKNFKKYHIFGFTGTPIFAVNAGAGKNVNLKTTEQAFGDCLHQYTIVDAINDNNVLPFKIDYINTIKESDDLVDSKVEAINTERAMNAPERIKKVVEYILEHFDQKTKRTCESFTFNKLKNIEDVASSKKKVNEVKVSTKLKGFNSIFAVSSIETAKMYYIEFKKQMKDLPDAKKLRVATIFSFCPNEEELDVDYGGDEDFDTEGLDKQSRDFLEDAIKDYNEMFKTNYDTSADKFQNYYKDLSLRVKNREIDILIVVNMFLTGFDATTLNTLWVDKNLRQHGLIQAYSRTNRILNRVKTFGNIVCFRDLQKETDDAIALFGDKEATGMVVLKDYNSYLNGYDEDGKHVKGYTELIDEMFEKFPLDEQIIGETNKKEFIKLFGKILRLRNILTAFDEFDETGIILPREFQDYQGTYLDIRNEFIHDRKDKEDIIDDLVFETELIKQIEINIDYILFLVKKYHDNNCKDKEILVDIERAINSSMELRSKKELIENFIDRVNNTSKIDEEWYAYLKEQQEEELTTIIEEEHLRPEDTFRFVENSFKDGVLKTSGTDIDTILPSMSLFGGVRKKKKETVIEKLTLFFEKYFRN